MTEESESDGAAGGARFRVVSSASSCRCEGSLASVEAPVLDRLRDVGHGKHIGAREVRDGPRNLEHAMVRTRREPQSGDRRTQDRLRLSVEGAEATDLPGTHVRVGMHPRNPHKPFALGETRALHPFCDAAARLRQLARCQVPVGNGRHLEVDVDSIEQRTRHAGTIALHRMRRTETGVCRIAGVAAGAPLPTH